jgi:hypothetical protein
MALYVLFRLLFIAHGEDRDLRPFRTHDSYWRRALKTKARELLEQPRDSPTARKNIEAMQAATRLPSDTSLERRIRMPPGESPTRLELCLGSEAPYGEGVVISRSLDPDGG